MATITKEGQVEKEDYERIPINIEALENLHPNISENEKQEIVSSLKSNRKFSFLNEVIYSIFSKRN